MCCFSRSVELVADTSIFARPSKDGRQFLVYTMKVMAGEDLAMILPIPTPEKSAEDAVKFLNLEKYPEFFDDMKAGFPAPPPPRGAKKDAPFLGGLGGAPLPVVQVGKFVASFVPAVKDFARLDAQFKLPDGVWEKLPQYKDFGFAVFKLKKTEKGAEKIHPMAFEFPRADKGVLFFPTVHIHDGTVPAKTRFDHALYCQLDGPAPMNWRESPGLAGGFMKKHKESHGILDPKAHVYLRTLRGSFENKDVAV